MIEEEAYVAEVAGDRVWIEKSRQSACSSCSQSCPSSLAGSLFTAKSVRLTVKTDLDLKPGDRVMVGLAEEVLAAGSFLVYLLPLFALFSGALFGKWLGGTDGSSALGGLLGLVSCFIGLKAAGVFERTHYQPMILRKID
ncbi:MAG: SoxR reducing system RseC family protein [Methylococcaceae bacterium]|nr:SoxR reducing system RseC family protein [Methylococcaceae bacterium]